MRKLASLFIVAMLTLGLTASATALQEDDSEITVQEGHLIFDLETSDSPDVLDVFIDDELVAEVDDFSGDDLNHDLTLDVEAGEKEVEVEAVVDGEESNMVVTRQVVDVFTIGEDVEQELSVSEQDTEFAEGLGLQDRTQGEQDVLVEAYSKIVLVEGHLDEETGEVEDQEDVEVVWEGTPSLLPSGDSWDRVHRDSGGEVQDSHTFSNTFYEEGDYSYVVYLASAESEYDVAESDWVSPEGDGTTYEIRTEDFEVYPFEVVEPEEPPSPFEALQQFFDEQTQDLVNLFR